MGVKAFFRGFLRRQRKQRPQVEQAGKEIPPLREFVYLDEVSLVSLLASQTGEVTEQVSSAVSDAREAELAAVIAANTGVAKSEVNSRYQTSNSTSTQTSRKALVQSLFKEFRERPGIEMQLHTSGVKRYASLDEMLRDEKVAVRNDRLVRGSLIEVEVELDVDPVFKMSMLLSEVAEMADPHPELFFPGVSGNPIEHVLPYNQVLQRLLTGLIPVRARAVNLSTLRVGDHEFVVRNDALEPRIGAELRPVEIVGVTEHLGYWKDIRRVLFSGARFTVLGRVGRDGIQSSWTPVKLTDLFKEVAPDLPDQISAAGRNGFRVSNGHAAVQDRQQEALGRALEFYTEKHAEQAVDGLSEEDRAAIHVLIETLKPFAGTVRGQNQAFRVLGAALRENLSLDVASENLLVWRREARSTAGLELFAVSDQLQPDDAAANEGSESDNALIDTEVIAIYW